MVEVKIDICWRFVLYGTCEGSIPSVGHLGENMKEKRMFELNNVSEVLEMVRDTEDLDIGVTGEWLVVEGKRWKVDEFREQLRETIGMGLLNGVSLNR